MSVTRHGDGRVTIDGESVAYLASPYSKYPAGIDAACADVAALAGRLIKAGIAVYSPIAHGHAISKAGLIDPFDHDFWLTFDVKMMARCDLLLVAEMLGWQHSAGIGFEIEWFTRAGKPVIYLDPVSLRLRATPLASVLAPDERAFA